MTNRRITYDADDGSPYAQLLARLERYSRAVAEGEHATAVRAAEDVRRTAEQLSDRALLAAIDGHASGRSLAAALGVVHGTVQHRIKQARARLHGTNNDEENQG